MRPRHIIILPVRTLGSVALALVLAGCNRSKGTPEKAAPSMAGMAGMSGMAGMNITGDSGVALDRPAAARLGITFARAANRSVGQGVRLAGTLMYTEPRRTYVNARVAGWVEHLDADYVGKAVRAGDVLLSYYSPDLLNAQEEYLAARRLGDATLISAARQRLVLWNVPEEDIAELERTGRSHRTLTLRAPRSGELAEKMVTEGQALRPGDNLFLIADRSVLWVEAAVFEIDAPLLRVGSPVTLSVRSLPGQVFRGQVSFIQPTVDQSTRTLTARVEVANRNGLLRPGMFATVELRADSRLSLAVPLEAVLPTGTTNLVFVNRGDGTFMPREVVIGARGDSLIEIRQGLKAGDEVVASATYLLDSESNLASAMQGLMLQMGMGLNMGGMASPSPSRTVAPPTSSDMKGMKMDSRKEGRP